MKATLGCMRWLETEWWEGGGPESGRPGGRVGLSGVRALIVAMKPGNAGGVKGRRKVDP